MHLCIYMYICTINYYTVVSFNVNTHAIAGRRLDDDDDVVCIRHIETLNNVMKRRKKKRNKPAQVDFAIRKYPEWAALNTKLSYI